MWHLKKTQCLIHTFTSAELLFSYSVVLDSLWPHGLQHPRLPCSSPSSGVCSNLRPLSQWAIQWFILCLPFSSCLQSFPASGSFPMSWFLAAGGQSIGASASASVFPMNIQGWLSLRLTVDLLAVRGTLKNLLQHHSLKASVLRCSAFFIVQLLHPYMTTEKNHSFGCIDLCRQSNVSAF